LKIEQPPDAATSSHIPLFSRSTAVVRELSKFEQFFIPEITAKKQQVKIISTPLVLIIEQLRCGLEPARFQAELNNILRLNDE